MDRPVYEIPDMSGSEVLGWSPRPLVPPRPPMGTPDAQATLTETDASPAAPIVRETGVAAVAAAPAPEGAPLSRRALRAQAESADEHAASVASVAPVATVTSVAPVSPSTAALPLEQLVSAVPADTVAEWLAAHPQAPTAAPAPAPARQPAALGRPDPQLIAALQEVVASKASDLHVTANAAPMLRVDGGLRAAPGTTVWDRDRVKSALYTLLTDAQRVQFEEELELDFAYTVNANARFRVNFYQQRDAIGAAFRLIPTGIKTLSTLGVPESVGRFAGLPRGLVLVTGPTGSGKSTTLAALIDLVNETRSDHIVTVEDPIEFLHNHKRSIINQREVGHDTHSFANALKHVLRQDPDVILVGELRDLETISVALTAAETGHLVFATLHTQDAPQTIDRMIDVFPPHQQAQVRVQLASTLQGVVSQTLIRRASGEGRAVATEVLITTPAVGNLIREGKTYQIISAMQAGRDLGMHTMDQHLAELVLDGTITREAALEKAHDAAGFDRLIQRGDAGADAAGRAFQAAGPDFGDSFSGGLRR
ncbi:PilT/PilU family type 4a pilus ATPase [Gryllotalpicola reticulitermitis]|uniref:PilT/PilU family type 4a pilus ATPase n=1 Tax=Gryllotalpicola reticulitermitis TaxID=1184153 RepID=A0ABV8Q1W3_9MICO